MTRKLIGEQPCLRVKDLAVSGSDLINLGMQPGPQIGQTLERLLQAVIDGDVRNEREELLGCLMKNE